MSTSSKKKSKFCERELRWLFQCSYSDFSCPGQASSNSNKKSNDERDTPIKLSEDFEHIQVSLSVMNSSITASPPVEGTIRNNQLTTTERSVTSISSRKRDDNCSVSHRSLEPDPNDNLVSTRQLLFMVTGETTGCQREKSMALCGEMALDNQVIEVKNSRSQPVPVPLISTPCMEPKLCIQMPPSFGKPAAGALPAQTPKPPTPVTPEPSPVQTPVAKSTAPSKAPE